MTLSTDELWAQLTANIKFNHCIYFYKRKSDVFFICGSFEQLYHQHTLINILNSTFMYIELYRLTVYIFISVNLIYFSFLGRLNSYIINIHWLTYWNQPLCILNYIGFLIMVPTCNFYLSTMMDSLYLKKKHINYWHFPYIFEIYILYCNICKYMLTIF